MHCSARTEKTIVHAAMHTSNMLSYLVTSSYRSLQHAWVQKFGLRLCLRSCDTDYYIDCHYSKTCSFSHFLKSPIIMPWYVGGALKAHGSWFEWPCVFVFVNVLRYIKACGKLSAKISILAKQWIKIALSCTTQLNVGSLWEPLQT